MLRHTHALLVVAAMVACGRPLTRTTAGADTPKPAVDDGREAMDDLEPMLRSDPELAAWLDDAEKRRIQVLVAIPETAPNGQTTLRRLAFRADAEYFYPASAVKLCVAFAAFEKLEELQHTYGRGVSLETPLRFIEGEGRRRRTLETTFRRELELALVVSDNDAFNRLFELVGREEVAERLSRAGFSQTRVIRRLGDTAHSAPPIIELLLPNRGPVLIGQRIDFPMVPPPNTPQLIGQSHVDRQGRIVSGPMDFSDKNAAPLHELQDLLILVARPDLSRAREESSLRRELLEILGTLPSELLSRSRSRGGQTLDALQKPLHAAVVRALPNEPIKVYGKGGRAYGFSVENAYVVNERSGRSFFIAATVYSNDNETMNDDRYDYESIGTPFLTRLGVALAQELLLPS